MFQMKKYMSPGMFQQRPQGLAMVQVPSDKMSSSPYGGHGGMHHHNVGGGDMGPMSPADPKPRLRWTPELHERFVDAVTQLGGADSKSSSATTATATTTTTS